jgi:hypothetical protein
MIETNLYDKSSWPRGEWDNEPEKIEFTDEETGYKCTALRNKYNGTWCGYVYIPKGHPSFAITSIFKHDVDVHGGISYSNSSIINEEWCLGFDCNHLWDSSPVNGKNEHNAEYRNKEYVLNEIRSLAKQLKELENDTHSN